MSPRTATHVGVAVGAAVGVFVDVGVCGAVAVGMAVEVFVGVGVCEAVVVAVAVGMFVGVTVCEAVGVGVCDRVTAGMASPAPGAFAAAMTGGPIEAVVTLLTTHPPNAISRTIPIVTLASEKRLLVVIAAAPVIVPSLHGVRILQAGQSTRGNHVQYSTTSETLQI